MDSRQVVSVNQAEGGERYLSPLAQLVGAESAISQRRKAIRRWQRELKQKTILAQYYSSADALLDREIEVARLLVELKALAARTLPMPRQRRNGTRKLLCGSVERSTTLR